MKTLLGIRAEYIGPTLISSKMPKYKDIKVYKIYQDFEEEVLGWVYERVEILNNSFLFIIKYNNYRYSLEVPFVTNQAQQLHAVYLGPPILIGQNIDIKHLYVTIKMKDGSNQDVSSNDYTVDKHIVRYTGNNVYTVSYADLSDKFVVFGYNVNNGKDMEFKAFLIHDNKYEEDITDMCYLLLYDEILDNIYVTTNKFNKSMFFGKYRLILPRDTGMLQKYASEWIINKTESNNILATIVQVYDKENDNE